EVVDLFRDRRWLEATLELHDRLPEVIEGAVTDAAPSFVPCDECKGQDSEHCWQCRGAGQIRRPGDERKLAFVGEAVGMTSKRGPAVQINQQFNAGQVQANSFENLMRRAVVKVNSKQIEGT